MGSKSSYSSLLWSSEAEASENVSLRRQWKSDLKRYCYGLLLLSAIFIIFGISYEAFFTRNGTSLLFKTLDSTSLKHCDKPQLRQEWRTLDAEQRKNFVNAVHCISTLPSHFIENGSVYDDYPWVHSLMAESAFYRSIAASP